MLFNLARNMNLCHIFVSDIENLFCSTRWFPAVLFAKLEADKIAEAVFRFEDVTKATMDKQSQI